jgi:AcrR family transcriptional regulator
VRVTPTTSEDRRRRILDATVELASGGGFDAVRMRAVAGRSGVALGTLYRYFPSKIHLLVCVLGRELERAASYADTGADAWAPGPTSAADRVMVVLGRTTDGLQRDPQLAEALTRAFMSADRSVSAEVHEVASLVTTMLTRAMDPDAAAPGPEQVSLARVIGDVWFSALVTWVNGRSTATQTRQHLETAVRLLLRD